MSLLGGRVPSSKKKKKNQKNEPKKNGLKVKIGNQINKVKKFIKGDKNPLQDRLNRKANIANTGSGKSTAAGRIQKKLVDAGHSKSDLRRQTEAHTAWKAARKAGKLKEWEKKYHPDRIKAGQSRYGNK